MRKFTLLLLFSCITFNSAFAMDAVILMGPPASGKGFLAKKLISKYQYHHISSGDLLRKDVSDKGINNKVKNGGLVKSDIVLKLFDKELKSHSDAKGIIIDGIPRTFDQINGLQAVLKSNNVNIKKIIVISCPYKILEERVLKRSKLESRSDDTPSVLKKRVKIFEKNSKDIVDKYKKLGFAIENLSCENMPDDISL